MSYTSYTCIYIYIYICLFCYSEHAWRRGALSTCARAAPRRSCHSLPFQHNHNTSTNTNANTNATTDDDDHHNNNERNINQLPMPQLPYSTLSANSVK